jgi:hypothetical protein
MADEMIAAVTFADISYDTVFGFTNIINRVSAVLYVNRSSSGTDDEKRDRRWRPTCGQCEARCNYQNCSFHGFPLFRFIGLEKSIYES